MREKPAGDADERAGETAGQNAGQHLGAKPFSGNGGCEQTRRQRQANGTEVEEHGHGQFPPAEPARRNGMVSTGMTASQSESARKPWTKPLARTMSRALSGVMNSRPMVPSRRSRLMQSAAMSGTISQMERNRAKFSQPNSRPPSLGAKPERKAKKRLTKEEAGRAEDVVGHVGER